PVFYLESRFALLACGLFDGEHQPVLADREPEARSGRPADHLRKPIVAPAPEQSVLGAERAAGDLESRARVIVEPPHQARRNLIRDPTRLEPWGDAGEVLAAFSTQMVQDARQLGDEGLVSLHLAVEHAQRVGLSATLAVLTQ